MQAIWDLSQLNKIIETQLLPLGLEDEEIIIILKAEREFLSPIKIP